MEKKNQLAAVGYKLEWIDHLYEIYRDFKRRNNVEEWLLFFRRPELADPEEQGKIAEEVLRYVMEQDNIAQCIVRVIEETFHYTRQREKYEDRFGYGKMEIYQQYQLETQEFPPFALFGDYEEERDYDGFIDAFRNVYFRLETEDAQVYKEQLDQVKGFEIQHPYMALLESEYYMLLDQWRAAAESLRSMENCYYKQMNLGVIFSGVGMYDMAEECFEEAIRQRADHLDPALIREYIMCKWMSGKLLEALDSIKAFSEKGYEYEVQSVKEKLLEALSLQLNEKARQEALTEEELLLVKEYCMIKGDYETVLHLGRLSWEQGYEDDSWTVDMAEAFFEMGQYEAAGEIVDMVYDGTRRVAPVRQAKLRVIRARILFIQGRIRDAFEIMERVCRDAGCTLRQQFILAQMYQKTGRMNEAVEMLSRLHFDAPGNRKYTHELARCLLDCGAGSKAHYLLEQIVAETPDFEQSAYYLVQASIDDGAFSRAQKELEIQKDYISERHTLYLRGQLEEGGGNYNKAKQIYQEIIRNYGNRFSDGEMELSHRQLLNNAYYRYFIMMEETGARVGEMIEQMKSVLKQVPDAAELWVYLGDFYQETDMEEDNESQECYEKALEADPFNEEAMMNLAESYAEEEKWNQLYELSNRLVVYTDSDYAYYLRAQSGLEIGKREECMQDLETSEKKGGDKYEINVLRGRMMMKQGQYREALDLFEQITKARKADEQPCYDDMALCLCKVGEEQEAIALTEMVCETSQEPSDYIRLFQMQMYYGHFKEAKKTLKQYRKQYSISRLADDYIYLGAQLLLESGGSILKAQAMAECIDSREGEQFCGILELLEGNYSEAVKIFKKLIFMQSECMDHYSWLCLTLFLQGQKQEATKYAKKGVGVFCRLYDPEEVRENPELLCQKGSLLIFCGEREAAQDAFSNALQNGTCTDHLCGTCYEAYYGLGILFAYNDEKENADQAFAKALEIRPYHAVCSRVRSVCLSI